MIVWLLAASLIPSGLPGGACAQSAAARRLAREIVESFGREALEGAEPRVAAAREEASSWRPSSSMLSSLCWPCRSYRIIALMASCLVAGCTSVGWSAV